MIAWVYDIIYDLTYDLTYDVTCDITVNPHINTILKANDFNLSIPHCAGQRSLAEARSRKLRTEVWKSWIACALRPACGWQRLHCQSDDA